MCRRRTHALRRAKRQKLLDTLRRLILIVMLPMILLDFWVGTQELPDGTADPFSLLKYLDTADSGGLIILDILAAFRLFQRDDEVYILKVLMLIFAMRSIRAAHLVFAMKELLKAMKPGMMDKLEVLLNVNSGQMFYLIVFVMPVLFKIHEVLEALEREQQDETME